MNENRNFNEDFEIEQAGPEDVGCDLFEYELTPEGTYVPKIAYTSDPEEEKLLKKLPAVIPKSLSADGDVHG